MNSRKTSSADTLARGLGWFSIGLGLAELLAPKTLGRALGMEDQTGLLQAYGVREIATGVCILASKDPEPFVWGRVAGDAVDLATLAVGLKGDNPQRTNVGIAIATVAAVTLVDIYCAQQLDVEDEAPPPMRDYSDRSGFPQGVAAARGAARAASAPTPAAS